jgi:UDP:flavonoid glycosyltransferase YjiC (YdhE family)
MKTLFTTLPSTSHFLTLIPFIQACKRRGHEVAVAAPAEFAERVAATGAELFPFGHPGDEGLRPLWMRLRGASEEETIRISIGEIFAGVYAEAALPSLIETLERWRPSIVVRESQEYAAVVAAEKVGIPHIRVAISAPSGEVDMYPYAAAPVDAHGRKVGLAPDPSAQRILGEAALTLFPSSLEAPEFEQANVFRFRAIRSAALQLPDWWGTLAGPLVYATLGTVVGCIDMMRPAYRAVLDAVADLPVRVLLTVGAELPLETLGDVPPNVHVERFVAQDEVIPHASAVLCHGGSGTVLGALAAGVPLVVAPMFADQPFNAARVASTGAGLALPTGKAPAQELRRTLSQVIEEGSFRAAARRIAAEIAALPTVDEAPSEIEALGLRA